MPKKLDSEYWCVKELSEYQLRNFSDYLETFYNDDIIDESTFEKYKAIVDKELMKFD